MKIHIGTDLNSNAIHSTTVTSANIASTSLTAIRYLMLLYTVLEHDRRLSEVRTDMSGGLIGLSFGQRLWGLFRWLIKSC